MKTHEELMNYIEKENKALEILEENGYTNGFVDNDFKKRILKYNKEDIGKMYKFPDEIYTFKNSIEALEKLLNTKM